MKQRDNTIKPRTIEDFINGAPTKIKTQFVDPRVLHVLKMYVYGHAIVYG